MTELEQKVYNAINDVPYKFDILKLQVGIEGDRLEFSIELEPSFNDSYVNLDENGKYESINDEEFISYFESYVEAVLDEEGYELKRSEAEAKDEIYDGNLIVDINYIGTIKKVEAKDSMVKDNKLIIDDIESILKESESGMMHKKGADLEIVFYPLEQEVTNDPETIREYYLREKDANAYGKIMDYIKNNNLLYEAGNIQRDGDSFILIKDIFELDRDDLLEQERERALVENKK